jgi:hypothetical protein
MTNQTLTMQKRNVIAGVLDDNDKNGSVERLIVNIIGKAFNVLGDFYKDIYRSVMTETDDYAVLFNDFAKSLNLSVNADSMSREDIKSFLEKYYAEKSAKLGISTVATSTAESQPSKRRANNDDEIDAKRIKDLVERKINKTVVTYGKKYKELITDFAVKFRSISEDLVNTIKGGDKE